MITKDNLRGYISAGLAAVGRTDEVRNTDEGVAVFGLDYRIVMTDDALTLISDCVTVAEAASDDESGVKAEAVQSEIKVVKNDESGAIEIARALALDIAEFMLDAALQERFDQRVVAAA